MLHVHLKFSTLLYNLCIYNIFCKISYLSIWWINDRKRMGILVDICKSHFLIKEDLNNLLPPVSSYRLCLAAHIHMTHTRLYLGYWGKQSLLHCWKYIHWNQHPLVLLGFSQVVLAKSVFSSLTYLPTTTETVFCVHNL